MADVAIYHFSAKTVSRAAGRSSTGAAAYRAGERIVDKRTGEIHDYTRKGGVVDSQVILPGGGTMDRADLWNAVEAKHKRGDAVVAREFVVALPDELNPQQRQDLARSYARELADRYGVAVDINTHAPGKDGDQRNHHAHILLSACYCAPDGTLGKKAVELDPIHCQRAGLANVVEVERERWENLANAALERAGQDVRIDHRSLEAQGITDRLPGVHLGPTATEMTRKGKDSQIERRARDQADTFMANVQAQATIEHAQRRHVAELEQQLATARWQATPWQERLQVVRQEHERHLVEWREVLKLEGQAREAIKKAPQRAEVLRATKALPAVENRVKAVENLVQVMLHEQGQLRWWSWMKRYQLKRDLPGYTQQAEELASQAKRLQAVVASGSVLDKAEEALAKTETQLQALTKQHEPVVHQLVQLEAQEQAHKAQEAATRQQVAQAAVLARAEVIRAHLQAQAKAPTVKPEKTAERSRDRDSGPSM